MIIKEAEYGIVLVEQNRLISDTVFGCDFCQKEIKEYPNEPNRLVLSVFNNGDAEDFHFCSWECVLKFLPKIKCNDFVSLPYMYFDCDPKNKTSGYELGKIIEKIYDKTTVTSQRDGKNDKLFNKS